ncbi:branched-chain amino acid ABC transporter permease [Verminephrobacter eiseniae]|uniref:branched-chain amino acid ABC transporter permease n=1 Tax=Verminephrobacter eiseniae TaxID=364317 RepID=UPI0010D4AFB4|nr:branched-chain amino acid ABC transporter permease [Verminephrobacter eiseniae]KAB7585094.1 branched-chain amino acid ABC transporter permease [Verminephrobacter sp. Larva24]MCW5230200.1 branched-chain amino acid ABC transporter permease [Verminephrobacter eiseniae]MCW5291933.1 branched-chain amino acid ABC transporter permease [Verminephrobacter eiseniae]MCW8184914.1 branched-chain amino acid ABC transporter permease [Verminephrobacter eiseniae]MCW8223658.1 branched-chain amino acid ABC tr
MKTSLKYLLVVLVLLAIAIPMGAYHTDVYRKLLLWSALALSFNFLFGISGQLALSHFTFYGLGAYAIVILSHQVGLPLPLAAMGASALCIVVSAAVAIPATRLEGFYLALATLALAQLVTVLLNEGGALTGGSNGLANYGVPSVLGFRLEGMNLTAAVILLLVLTFGLLRRLDRSQFGRACRAVRDDPAAASAMGIDVSRTKIAAYMLASCLAAAAGMCYAFVDRNVNPAAFGIEYGFLLLFAVIVGGVGSQWGAIFGGVLVFVLPLFLAPLIGHYHALIFGIVVVLIMLLEPRGLVGVWLRARSARRSS